MRLIFILSIIINTTVCAQDFQLKEDGWEYQVVSESEVEPTVIYQKLNQWMVENYRSSEDVIELQDKDAGLLMGKGIGTINIINRFGSQAQKDIRYTFKIEIKEYRYRMTYTDVLYIDEPNQYNGYQRVETAAEVVLDESRMFKKNGKPRVFNHSLRDGTDELFDEITNRINEYIESSTADDDW
jgi:hypothetical protein